MIIIQSAMEKSGLYSIDDYGVKEYNYLFLGICSCAVYAAIEMFFGTLLYWFEAGHPQVTIKTWADAVWLMVMSSTTIGFGDFYPVTTFGRVCVFINFCLGVGILGAVGAIFANKIFGFADTGIKNRELRKQNADIIVLVTELTKKIDNMEQMLDQQSKKD
ncbi:MAG: potassium channel family protein [Ferrimonas sp.]